MYGLNRMIRRQPGKSWLEHAECTRLSNLQQARLMAVMPHPSIECAKPRQQCARRSAQPLGGAEVRTARFRLSLISSTFAFLAPSLDVAAGDGATHVAPILRKLSSALKRIESDTYGDADKVMRIRLTPLVGLSKVEIIAALGESGVECDSEGTPWCTRKGDVVFSFYTMCEDCLGGGPELSLSFDDSGKCVRAQWAITE